MYNSTRPPSDAGSLKLLGYLARPRGPQAGPFPAVVILHHCGGFDDLVVSWADRLSLWGYVALAVDSFGPRKVPGDCTSRTYQEFDSSSAFDFLAQQNFVDISRLAELGFSQGGMATLRNAEQDSALAKSHSGTFRAAVAFYPNCSGISGIMAVPTLMLTGESDDWTPAMACQLMADGRSDIGMSREKGDRSMLNVVVYPEVYHYFNAPILRYLTQVKGVRFMGQSTRRALSHSTSFASQSRRIAATVTCRQLPVYRHRDESSPHAAEKSGEELRAIGGQDRYTLAPL